MNEGTLEKEHYALLLRVSEILGSSLDIQQILDHILEQVIKVIGAERVLILMRESQISEWRCRSARNMNQEDLEQMVLSISKSVLNRVQNEGVSVLTRNALQDGRFMEKESIRSHNIRSILCVPIYIRGEILGVIYADNRIKTSVFGKREVALLEGIARQAAISLENALLYEKLDEKKSGLQNILASAPEMHRIQNFDSLLASILSLFNTIFPITHSFLAINSELFISMEEISGNRERGKDLESLSIVAETGKFKELTPALAAREASRILKAIKEDNHNESGGLSIPLKIGDRLLGAIYFERNGASTVDEELINIYAAQASLAIEKCRLFGLATEDSLTKTYLRNYFSRRLQQELYQAFRQHYAISLCIADIDKFKSINDRYGHPAGDQILREASRILRTNMRLSDFIGRYGGDEFIISYPYTDASGAEIIGNRLLSRLRNHKTPILNTELSFTLSLGIVSIKKEAMENITRYYSLEEINSVLEGLIEITDKALYEAKEAGGGHIALQVISDVNTLIAYSRDKPGKKKNSLISSFKKFFNPKKT